MANTVLIVGSGPSGCACAAALLDASKDPTLRVLVVERGPELAADATARWGFPSSLMEERAYAACGYAPFAGCAWAGTVAALGGGSALNAGALIEDETYWANEWGGCGARWRPAAMARCAAAALARLGVDAAPPPDPRSDVFVGACGAAGLDDAFRPRLAFDRRGRRCGAWRLLPADDARLRVVHGEALRILTAAGRATGVRLADGARLEARAVVVAAGPEETVKLLRRSQLDGGGAVGRGLSDHPSVALPLLDLRGAAPPAAAAAAAAAAGALLLGGRRGAAAAAAAAAAALALRPRSRAAARAAPAAYAGVAWDARRTFQLSYLGGQGAVCVGGFYGGAPRAWRGARAPGGAPRITAAARVFLRTTAALLRTLGWTGGREPVSVGAVVATAAAPATRRALDGGEAPPLHARDVEVLVDGLRAAATVTEALLKARDPPAGPWTRGLEAAAYRVLSICGAAPRMDGSDAEAFVRGCCGTLWHPAGGACRGDALDAESLELRGCEGVCVVGAAAMPALPRVNPSLSCYAMGWRLGELLAAE